MKSREKNGEILLNLVYNMFYLVVTIGIELNEILNLIFVLKSLCTVV